MEFDRNRELVRGAKRVALKRDELSEAVIERRKKIIPRGRKSRKSFQQKAQTSHYTFIMLSNKHFCKAILQFKVKWF